ncbi:MAG: hypothetical protein ACE5D4_06190 [Thermodesulfobacteriota bacterium]
MLSFLYHRSILPALLLLALSLTLILSPPDRVIASTEGAIKVAILPFHAPSPGDNGEAIAMLISSALSRTSFITVLPNEIILTRVREVSPALLWGAEKGGERSGGLIWRIDASFVQEIAASTSANYTIYGAITRFGEGWRIETTLSAVGKDDLKRSFTSTGLADEEIPVMVGEVAQEIVLLIQKAHLMTEAGEVVRLYLAGISTYGAAAERLEELAGEFPDHLPLHLLILNHYLKDKPHHHEEILRVGHKAIALYKGANEEELRYLRVYDLDPFDVTAMVYEGRNQWERAIDIRVEALQLISRNLALHRAALGLDYYHLARFHDKTGRDKAAMEGYRKALEYLPQHSKEFPVATERLKLLSTLPSD